MQNWNIINPGVPGPPTTVVVLGCYRGGTSMIAAIIRELGIDLGEYRDPEEEEAKKPYPDFEDLEAQHYLHGPVWDQLRTDHDPTIFDTADLNHFEGEVIRPKTARLGV